MAFINLTFDAGESRIILCYLRGIINYVIIIKVFVPFDCFFNLLAKRGKPQHWTLETINISKNKPSDKLTNDKLKLLCWYCYNIDYYVSIFK